MRHICTLFEPKPDNEYTIMEVIAIYRDTDGLFIGKSYYCQLTDDECRELMAIEGVEYEY